MHTCAAEEYESGSAVESKALLRGLRDLIEVTQFV